MKKIFLFALSLFSLAGFAQDVAVSGDVNFQGLNVTSNSVNSQNYGSGIYFIPMNVEITHMIGEYSDQVEDYNNINAAAALVSFRASNLNQDGVLEDMNSGDVILTAEGNILSLKQRVVFLKGNAANYRVLSLAEANIGAVLKVGEKVYLQIEAYASIPGKALSDDSDIILTEDEVNEYITDVGCFNCQYFSESNVDVSNNLMEYGANFKVRYKTLSVKLFNNNYSGFGNARYTTQNRLGESTTHSSQEVNKASVVREFGVEVEQQIKRLGKRATLAVVAGYSVAYHKKTLEERDDVSTLNSMLEDQNGTFDQHISTTRIERVNSDKFGMLKVGIRVNF